ncbi:MAG: hypothetical protein KA746_06235 [Pyrinomonadaceae bacterium]|nr:hypothetical protein [Pyrinomonadaceae bacterium]
MLDRISSFRSFVGRNSQITILAIVLISITAVGTSAVELSFWGPVNEFFGYGTPPVDEQQLEPSDSNSSEMEPVFFAARSTSQSGPWNDTATWGGLSVPVAGDTVTINSGHSVTVTVDAECTSLTFTTTAANETVTIDSGATLTVSGAITIPQANNGFSNTLDVGAGALSAGSLAFTSGGGASTRHRMTISTGTASVTGDVTQASSTGSASIIFTGVGTLNLGGAFLAAGTGTITPFAGSTVNYTGSGTQTIQTWNYSNLSTGTSGTKTLAANTTIAGDLTVGGTSTLNLLTFTANRTAVGGTLTVAGGATMQLGNNAGGQGASNFPANFNTISLAPTSTVNYSRPGSQTIYPTPTYGNLTLSGGAGGDKTAGAALNIAGSVTIAANTLLLGSTFTHNVGGNWSNSGTYSASSSSVIFNGTTQTISGSATSFNNLTISSTSTTTGSTAPTVNGNFTIQNGGKYIQTTGAVVPGTSKIFGANSTYEWRTGGGTTFPSTSGITFGNLLINTATGNNSAGGNVTSIAGNLQIISTTGGSYRLAASTSPTVSIGGNLIIDAGELNFTSGTGAPTVSVVGNVLLNGGILRPTASGGTGVPIFNVAGDWTNGGAFAAGIGRVTFNRAGVQTIAGTTAFYNVTLSGSGAKSITTGSSVSSNFNISGSASANLGNGANISAGTLTLGGLGTINDTWGSTSSPANFKNDSFFAASTGIVTVGANSRTAQAPLSVVSPGIVTIALTVNLNTAGGSGTGLVSFSVGSSTGCTVAGNVLTVTNSTGTCSVTATKAADGNYNQNSSSPLAVTLAKANQSTPSVTAPSSVTYGTTGTLNAAGGDGTGAYTYSVGVSTGCNISEGTTVNVTNASGNCNATVTKAGDSNYNVSAASSSFPIPLVQASQTIIFAALANKIFGNPPFTVSASGGASGNPVTFGVAGDCSIAVDLVTITGPGSCTVTASQAGNNNYAAAIPVPQSFTINDAAPTSLEYSSNPVTYTRYVTITDNTPSNSGGTPTSYSVLPALPAGLSLNPTTGVISGTPTTISAAAAYTVTATNSGGFTTANVNIAVGPRNLTISSSGDLLAGSYDTITIDSAAVVNLTGDIVVDGCLTVSGATFNMGTYTVSGPGCFTVGSGSTLGIGSPDGITTGAAGNVQVTGARTYGAGATYVYNGSVSQAVGDGLPSPVENLTINNSGPDGPAPAEDNKVTGNGGQEVTGTLHVIDGNYESHSDYHHVVIDAAGTLTLTNNITVSGNWTNNGGTLAGNFGVTLDGATGQTITGNTSFYNLTKSVAAAQTLYLAAGSTTTVTNALTLNGATGQLLSLRSNASPTQWNLAATGSRSVSFVDVQYSNATSSGTAISAPNSLNSGNNDNWNFPVMTYTISGNIQQFNFPSPNTDLAGVSVTISGNPTPVLTDIDGNFIFTGVAPGSYLITPALASYTFDPTYRNVDVTTANVTGVNFTGYTGASPRGIAVGSQTIVAGNNAVVPITMQSQGNENTIAFSLTWNTSYLTGATVAAGSNCGDCSITPNITAGQLGVLVSKPTATTFGSGTQELIKITFTTFLGSPPSGSAVTFGDTPSTRQVLDTNADPLFASYTSGAVTFAIDQTAMVTNSPATYTGSPQSADVSCSGGGLASNITTGGSAAQTGAGTYPVFADCPAMPGYNPGTSLAAGNFVIDKANAVVVVTPYNVVYDALPHTAMVASITGVLGETGPTVGSVDLSNTIHTLPGVYNSDFWTFTGTANYNDISATTITNIITTGTIPGSVTYSIVSKPVPGVLLSGVGSVFTSATTDMLGAYSLTNFGAGAYTITPSRTTQPCLTSNGVQSFDASLVAQHVVGLLPLTGDALKAAKVSGLPMLSSFEAALIARKVVGICDAPSMAGQWFFTPASVTHGSVSGTLPDDNYTAYMMGDVDGNWSTAASPSLMEPIEMTSERAKDAVWTSVPNVEAAQGSVVTVPFNIDNLRGRSIGSYQFDIEYDPTVLEPIANSANAEGTNSAGLSVVSNSPLPGLLKVAVYGAVPVNGDGVYMNLRFRTIGGAGSASRLTISHVAINEGNTDFTTTYGLVTVTASANNASIQGRLLTSIGLGINNARVILTSSSGDRRSAISSSLGSFAFSGLTVGETYTVSVQAKRFTFVPQTVSVGTDAVNLDLIAQ